MNTTMISPLAFKKNITQTFQIKIKMNEHLALFPEKATYLNVRKVVLDYTEKFPHVAETFET